MEKKNIIVIGIILVFLIVIFGKNLGLFSTIGTIECYQETATQSTACGGLGTGSYVVTDTPWSSPSFYIYDGNWDTDAYLTSPSISVTGYLYINYTKPSGALDSSLWRVKNIYGIFNLTIPSSCWDYNPNILSFRAVSDNLRGAVWECYNFSGWNALKSSDSMRLYEEAMIWRNEKNCNTGADINCDGIVDRAELGIYITKWINNQISRDELGQAIVAWIGG